MRRAPFSPVSIIIPPPHPPAAVVVVLSLSPVREIREIRARTRTGVL